MHFVAYLIKMSTCNCISAINVTVSDTLDYSSLLELAADIVSECQVGDISSSFNISGGCNSVTVPAGDLGEEPIVYSTPTPDHLMFDTELEPEYEGVPLKIHPKIRVRDIAVSNVELLHHYPSHTVLTI